jgi:hypothetical protein
VQMIHCRSPAKDDMLNSEIPLLKGTPCGWSCQCDNAAPSCSAQHMGTGLQWLRQVTGAPRRASCTTNFTLHDLRRTVRTRMAARGVPD